MVASSSSSRSELLLPDSSHAGHTCGLVECQQHYHRHENQRLLVGPSSFFPVAVVVVVVLWIHQRELKWDWSPPFSQAALVVWVEPVQDRFPEAYSVLLLSGLLPFAFEVGALQRSPKFLYFTHLAEIATRSSLGVFPFSDPLLFAVPVLSCSSLFCFCLRLCCLDLSSITILCHNWNKA